MASSGADRKSADARDVGGQAEIAVLEAVERARGGYIYLSLKEWRLALKAYDTSKPFAGAVVNGQAEYWARRRHMERAYEYATMVADDVLDRAHPEMRARWRDQYEKGLRLRIRGDQNTDSVTRSTLDEFTGYDLMNKFFRWWNGNRRTVRTALRGR